METLKKKKLMLLENSPPPLITFLKVHPFITINRQKL